MANNGKVIAGFIVAGGAILLLAKRAAGELPADTCFLAQGGVTYFGTWMGKKKKLPDAFGQEAWNIIETVKIFYPVFGEWDDVPFPAWDYKIKTGEQVRFIVQADVEVCGFRRDVEQI